MKPTHLLKLKLELKKPLPGKLAHITMAPEGRSIIENPSYQKNAAVALLIFQNNEGKDEIIFIKRNEYEGHHSGQVSFPGGKEDPEDVNLIQTAIRECNEEIGVLLTKDDLVGGLTPLFVIVSKFMIHPYIFYLNVEPSFVIDVSEVSYLIRFPMNELVNSDLKKKKPMHQFDNDYMIPYYDIKNETVWGATAMILAEFVEILKKV